MSRTASVRQLPQVKPLLAVILLGPAASAATVADPRDELTPFLKSHCYECHGPETAKGGLRLDTLDHNPANEATFSHWQDVLSQLRLGDMPPPQKPQPEAAEKNAIIELLSATLRDARTGPETHAPPPAIRRLNRIELRNTLRDLLHLQQPVFRNLGIAKPEDANGDGTVSRNSEDPVREFPADEREHGFDTIGSRLVMSDFLLKLVINAAEECLDLATVPNDQPPPVPRQFAGHIRTDGPASLEGSSRRFNPDFDVLMARYLEPGAASNVGRIAPTAMAATGVGVSGRYRLTVEASSHHQRHSWGELIRGRQDEPSLLGLHLIDARRGVFNEANPNTELLKQWPLPDDGQKRAYVFETWIDSHSLPWFGWENGPHERGLSAEKLVEKYYPAAHRPPPEESAPAPQKEQYHNDMVRELFTAGYAGPHIRIHSLTIEPLPEAWPPPSHALLYGRTGHEPIDELLQHFAHRAWRRPPQPEETHRYIALAQARRDAGASREEALRIACTAILASPNFYYLREVEGAGDFNLASRLSYFLWSSMPDEELMSLAAAGQLSDPAVRRHQVERMLNHRHAASFIRRFTEAWLRLDKLGTMPPSGGFYFHRQMEGQLLRQTDAYFAELVERNGPIRELIDSNYTFLNERTATWIYQRDDVRGDAFRKVPAQPPHGGGMLTMPAVMTATANGVDTSPIVRGVWVLESVFGTPPSPPPPNIEPLSPDLRHAQTIREQLEAHRAQESCLQCHRKIDPPGFAFENFDELGLWRTHYKNGDQPLKIDPSSTLPDGTTIHDINDMKQLMLEKEEQIARTLVEKMLTYATGRILTPQDQSEVERILAAIKTNGYRLRDLIHHVAASTVFLPR